VLAASVLLAACGSGDGGNDGKTKASFNKVVSFGASLTDSGTFGYKFTVQQATAEQQNVLWNERIAKLYGIATTCAVFNSSLAAANAGTCTNYAVAGSNINNYDSGTSTVDNTSPKSILAQLGTAATVGASTARRWSLWAATAVPTTLRRC
jgi:hypothetical protein